MLDQKGFSLVELIVVIAIIGILAAISIPSYNNYRLRSNRSEARAALTDAAQRAERYFTRNNTYNAAALKTSIEGATEHGIYNLTFAAASATSYTITATAAGSQAKDTSCAALTISQTGAKAPAACW